MKTLKSFLTEEKNVHMEHLSDLPFNEGVDGTRKAILFLRDLRDMLAGNSLSSVTATVKWDGAPAVFAGVDPRDGKFFVAKKGVFNKDPVVYKTQEDIDRDIGPGDLNHKMSIALKEFKKLGITSGIYQGDIMFTHDTIKLEMINGKRYVTFHPNTIVYSVPDATDLARTIKAAQIGVVWHTTYSGSSFENMKASFGKNITDKLNQTRSVWMIDATYQDYSGTATFTKQETDEVTAILSQAGTLFSQIDAAALNAIKNDPDLLVMVKTYNNSKVRAGEEITDTHAHVAGLFHYIWDKFEEKINNMKTEKGKQSAIIKRDRLLQFFKSHDKSHIVKIYDLVNLLDKAKHMIIDKMNKASHISTFLKTQNGFKITAPEGFVAIDKQGNAVKLVDRMTFSKANFSSDIVKGWER
jgi:hypothetical protein